MIRTTLEATSGPMPSPGISVIVCFIWAEVSGKWSVVSSQGARFVVLSTLVFLDSKVKGQSAKHKVHETSMSSQPFNSMRTADAIVVGGGVIGLTITRALARRGRQRIILIERARLGAEASSAAAGILAPQAEANQADEFFE